MDKNNPLVRLMNKFQKGNRPAIHMRPFLPLDYLRQKELSFNEVMRDPAAMEQAALMSFEFGFESTVLPFDLNVEAEMLGAQVQYHDGFDGNPVYPTIATYPFSPEDDIQIPDALPETGRFPAILNSISAIKEQTQKKGAIGVFIPGPFTLAGQIMDIDALFRMILKQPEKTHGLLEQLTRYINQLIDLYTGAGANFMILVEGGGASIAPKTFRKVLLPFLKEILKPGSIPKIASFSGKSTAIIECMLSCETDGIMLAKGNDIETARKLIPMETPLFGECGSLDMLATSTPLKITQKVHDCLNSGFTTVCPPADIYPPAKIENIHAFVKAVLEYQE